MRGARSFTKPLKLSEAVGSFCDGDARIDDVSRAYYEDGDVRRVVLGVCSQLNVSDVAEDVYQEVGVRLATKLIHRIRDADAIYGVIKATARNIGKDLIRQRVARNESSLDELVENVSENGDASHIRELQDDGMSSHKIDQKIDAAKASDQFNSLLASFYTAERSILLPRTWLDPDGSLSREPRPIKARLIEQQPKRFSADTLFLQKLRNVLGVPNAELARLLGQTETVVSYYLYTPRVKVPQALMAEARGLYESLPSTDIHTTDVLEHTPVPEVVRQWMTALGIDSDSKSANEDFAKLIGVTRSTVWRWRASKLKPKLTVLSATQKLVMSLQAQSTHS